MQDKISEYQEHIEKAPKLALESQKRIPEVLSTWDLKYGKEFTRSILLRTNFITESNFLFFILKIYWPYL